MTKQPTGAGLHRNLTSYFGLIVVAVSAALILATMLWGLALKQPSPYLGIFTYMIFPAALGCGMLMFLYGMRRESVRRRRLHTTEALPYPRLDLNDPRHRRKFIIVMIGGTLLAILLAFVGYNAFIFTESVTFCGRLCHTVMEPEYAAYQHSPHAKVRCVDCHVGSGASFYVKSKLSGVRQVFAVLFHTYSTPIETPVKNLRPARETCEECHWPQKFYGAQLLQIPYFRFDEASTSDQISLLMKTGGGIARLGQSAGIHWHMIIDNTITFATPDEKQQAIPWFKVKGSRGGEREYLSLDNPVPPQELAKLPRHTLDCMDCHNRPTHIYTPPDRAIDLAMNNGAIPKNLPWIKKTTAEAIMAAYPDGTTASREIQDRIFNFYAKTYPELYRTRMADIRLAVATVQDIYARSVFPKMKVDWRTYPDNIGHRNWPGCFRCHDGRHATRDGKILTRECTACHTMPQRGPLESLGALPPVTDETWHPMPLKGKHAEILCNRCHSPGIRPSTDCSSCHKHPAGAPMADVDCSSCHQVTGQRQPQNDCKTCHDSLKGLHTKGGHPDAECRDCHKPHTWKVTGRETCLTCHEDKKGHNSKGACADCHAFKAAA
jgi:hypothetical protein